MAKTTRQQRRNWEYQQRQVDASPLTVNERLTRVVHAILVGDDDRIQRETVWLVRAARHAELLKRMV